MKALIYKDMFILKQKGQLFSLFSQLIYLIPIGYFFQNFYGLALIVVLSAPLGGSAFLQVVMEKEERTNFEKAYMSLPVTKNEVILARFITSMFYLLITMIFPFVYMLVFVYYFNVVTLDVGLIVWCIGFIIGIIMLAMNSVGYHLLGARKGTFVYLTFAAISVILYFVAFLGFDVSQVLLMKPIDLVLIGAVIAVICLFVSYIASLKILQRKYS